MDGLAFHRARLACSRHVALPSDCGPSKADKVSRSPKNEKSMDVILNIARKLIVRVPVRCYETVLSHPDIF